MTTATFPFSAVVGNDDAKLALLLNAVEPRIGGVLLRGEKGSAKSTLARALAHLLAADAPFVELPLSATEDRLVGMFDLKAALTTGERVFQPGLLATADGGVLYVDEVNLLADHLVDILLDVAASGINRVEREGVSHVHPSRFVLVGSMNPEEGDLRPQLLDRFGLAVDVVSSREPGERAEAVRRRLDFDGDPEAVVARFGSEDATLGVKLRAASLPEVDDDLLSVVSRLCVLAGAEGLRADLVICRAAAALAGLEGRAEVSVEDVRRVAPLALAHRRRRSPFEEPGIEPEELDEALAAAQSPETGEGGTPPASEEQAPAEPDQPLRPRPLSAPRTSALDPVTGRRSTVEGPRGRLVGDRPASEHLSTVALGATLSASFERRSRAPSTDGPIIEMADLREAVREQKTGNLVILAIDASASMGVERRMEAVKGAVLGLLLDAYQRRDRVALVTFNGDVASVVLRPTGSVEVARMRLAELSTGGKTPLAAGIETSLELAVRASGAHRPLLVLISDGRATAAGEGIDPFEAAKAAAARVRQRQLPAVVIDVEDGAIRLGLAAELAEAMGARHLLLPELSSGALIGAIKEAVGVRP